MITIPLSLLIERGVQIDAPEAVAIVQALASAGGSPTIDNIEIDSDGDVRCRNSQGEPDVRPLAALLDRLLPKSGIPAALRYTVARGLGVVEAPPFESVEDFSRALSRFAAEDRAGTVRALLTRARPSRPVVPAPAAVVAQPEVPPAPALRLASPTAPRVSAPAPRVRPDVAAAPPPPPRLPQRSFLPVLWITGALALSALGGYAIVDYALSRQMLPLVNAPVRSTTPMVPSPAASQVSEAPAKPTIEPAPQPEVRKAAVRSSTPVPLLPVTGQAYSPAFSPNGTAVFFQTGGANDPTSAIAVGDANGGLSNDLGIMKIVDDGSRNYHAQPSPDGRFVAFDSDREGQRAVYIAERDGSNVRRISGGGYSALPSWSPDGSHLAFVRAEPDTPGVWNLWLQQLTGGPPQRLTRYHDGQTWAASWFPDGRRIAYSHETELMILDLRTSRMQHIASPIRGRLVRTPAVSPDGSRIVFQVFRAGAWMLNVADGSMECVLADPSAEEFAWAPDGRRFAFHSRQDGRWGIYVLSSPTAS